MYGIGMEYGWNTQAICMGSVWNMYGTSMCGRLRYIGEAVWYDGGMTDTLILACKPARSSLGLCMEYEWNMYGTCVWNMYGICMEYVWNMHGIGME